MLDHQNIPINIPKIRKNGGKYYRIILLIFDYIVNLNDIGVKNN